jgi:iron complex transport system substrate-binding protein
MKRSIHALFALSVLGLAPSTIAEEWIDERIVTLGGAITETVFALGAGDAVVARDDTSLRPAEVLALPSVGYVRTIGAEGVLGMRPSLILLSAEAGPPEQVALLESSGTPLVRFRAEPSVESIFAMVEGVGAALGRETAATQLKAELEKDFEAVESLAARHERPPSIVVLMSGAGNSYAAAYDQTAATALIELIGGRNPFTGMPGYKPTSVEQILATDPDYILLATRAPRGDGLEPLGDALPGHPLAHTRAAREGRIFFVDLGEFFVFGPHLARSAKRLAEVVTPIR